MALETLNLVGDAAHGRTGTDESGQQRLEGPLARRLGRLQRPFAHAAQLKPLPDDRRKHLHAVPQLVTGVRCHDDAGARGVAIFAERLHQEQGAPELAMTSCRGLGEGARDGFVAAGRCQYSRVASRGHDEHGRRIGVRALEQRGGRFASEQVGQDRGFNQAPNRRLVGVGRWRRRRHDGALLQEGAGGDRLLEIALRSELGEHRAGQIEVALRRIRAHRCGRRRRPSASWLSAV